MLTVDCIPKGNTSYLIKLLRPPCSAGVPPPLFCRLVGIIMYAAPLSVLQEVLRTKSSKPLPVMQILVFQRFSSNETIHFPQLSSSHLNATKFNVTCPTSFANIPLLATCVRLCLRSSMHPTCYCYGFMLQTKGPEPPTMGCIGRVALKRLGLPDTPTQNLKGLKATQGLPERYGG